MTCVLDSALYSLCTLAIDVILGDDLRMEYRVVHGVHEEVGDVFTEALERLVQILLIGVTFSGIFLVCCALWSPHRGASQDAAVLVVVVQRDRGQSQIRDYLSVVRKH